MKLSDTLVKTYQEQGYFVLPDFFSPAEIELLRAEAGQELRENNERVVREPDGDLVRATHGSHMFNATFANLVRLPRLLALGEQLLEGPVYVHQFKINAKAALGGEHWEWHQDFYFWQVEDGMPEPLSLNLVIHLDEANDLNGPLLVVPGSHRLGEVPTTMRSGGMGMGASASQDESDWLSTVSTRLKHTLDRETLRTIMADLGVKAVTAPVGSLLVFHPSLLHGSASNMSPYDRRLVIISYNAVRNQLGQVARPRPEFLASRNFTPIQYLPEDVLHSRPSAV